MPRKKTPLRAEVLNQAIVCFARAGYEGVSMRDLAAASGVSATALYYHFKDKEDLYVAAVSQAFKENTRPLWAALNQDVNPWHRLEALVLALTELLAREEKFLRLLQWVMLDQYQKRQLKLADEAFRDLFQAMNALIEELGSSLEPHALTVSILGMIVFPFETETTRRFLPGYQPQGETPSNRARHIITVLRQGILPQADTPRTGWIKT